MTMSLLRRYVLLVVALMVLATPVPAFAQSSGFLGLQGPIFPERCRCVDQEGPGGARIQTAPDFACALQVAQNVLNLIVSLAVIAMTFWVAYAGWNLVISAGNPKKIQESRERFLSIAVGIFVILAAWLLVDFVMKTLYRDASFGPWNAILSDPGANYCIVAREPNSIISGTLDIIGGAPGASTAPPASGEGVTSDGTIPGRICSAATAYRGTSTASAPGTSGGALACAWAVNEVLKKAGIQPIGTTQVTALESGLKGDRGQLMQQSQSRCGDIVIVTSSRGNHTGICLNTGCTSVISNSTGRRSFSWQSGPSFAPSYNSSNYRIYRVTK